MKQYHYHINTEPCKQCGKELPSNRWRFCSDECYRLFTKAKYEALNPRFGRTSATTGAISELRVSVDLMQRGYDVFRALSPSCPCDLAVLKNGKLLRIEVRTCRVTNSGTVHRVKSSGDNLENIDVYAWVFSQGITYEPSLP